MKVGNCYFRIADFNIRIIFNDTRVNNRRLIASYAPFERDAADDLLLTLTVDDSLPVKHKEERRRIDRTDTGNGVTVIDSINGGGYQFIIKNNAGYECCLLQTDAAYRDFHCALNGNDDMRRFGLNNALMIVFMMASSAHDTVMIHASLVRHGGYGYAFTASSGTGKSTHTGLWMRTIEGCDLMNDDNPVIRIIDGQPVVYGTPWSGKTPCYRQTHAPLGAVTRIDRSAENSIERLPVVKAFASLLPSFSLMRWDPYIFNNVCKTIIRLVECDMAYILHCRPDEEAALICHRAISRQEPSPCPTPH